MSLATYDDLKMSIISWAIRDGDTRFASGVPDFIAGCEQQLNYGLGDNPPLRCAEMETSDYVTMTDGAGDLPSDFLEWRGVTVGTLPYEILDVGTPSDNQARYGSAASGTSARFQINGTTLKTYPPSSSDVTLDYYAKIPSLSLARQTNWLLQKAPMVYLYGSLMHSAPFMQDDDRVTLWTSMYQSLLNGLIGSDKRARFSRMISRVAGPTP